jgi:hypothetical protein
MPKPVPVQVDAEMRILLQNLKDMLEAEKAAKAGKKKGKKKGGKKKGAKKKGAKGKGAKKGKKDPTADRSMESLFSELVINGILQRCEQVCGDGMRHLLLTAHYHHVHAWLVALLLAVYIPYNRIYRI